MTSGVVRRDLIIPPRAAMIAGRPVSGQDWSQMGHAANWIMGRGRSMVPCYMSEDLTINKGAYYEMRYAFWPTGACSRERWSFDLQAPSTLSVAAVTARIQGGTESILSTRAPGDVGGDNVLHYDRASLSESRIDRTVRLDVSATGANPIVQCISCDEIPAARVHTAQDGVDPYVLSVGRPILAANATDLYDVSQRPYGAGRRMLAHYAAPYAVSGVLSGSYAKAVTGAAYSTILHGVPVLAPTHRVGDTTATCKGVVWAWCSDGTTAGQVLLQSASVGSGTAITIAAGTTSPAWSSDMTCTIDAEDRAEADGLPGSAWDTVSVLARRTAGSGTLYIASASLWAEEL